MQLARCGYRRAKALLVLLLWLCASDLFAQATITGGVLSADNSTVTVTFSANVWGDSANTLALDASSFNIAFLANGGTATGASIASVSHTAGSPTATLTLSIAGTPSGVETVEVTPAAASVWDSTPASSLTSTTTGLVTLNDQLPPTLSVVSISSSDARSGYGTQGSTVTLNITASESLNTPTVLINGSSASVSGAGTTWSATLVLSGALVSGTAISFSINASDLAGNAMVAVSSTTDASAVSAYNTLTAIATGNPASAAVWTPSAAPSVDDVLILNSAFTLTQASTVSVYKLTISAGTWAIGSQTLNVGSGGFSSSGTLSYSGGTTSGLGSSIGGTVQYTGGSSWISGVTSYTNLTIAGANLAVGAGGINVSTSLALTSGTLDLAGNGVTGVATLGTSSGTTLYLQGGESVPSGAKSLFGTVVYNGSAGAVSLALGYNYTTLSFNGSGTPGWTVPSALTVTTLSISSGNALNVSAVGLSGVTTVTNNGSIVVGGSSLSLGTAAYSGSGAIHFSSGATVAFAASSTVASLVSDAAGANITMTGANPQWVVTSFDTSGGALPNLTISSRVSLPTVSIGNLAIAAAASRLTLTGTMTVSGTITGAGRILGASGTLDASGATSVSIGYLGMNGTALGTYVPKSSGTTTVATTWNVSSYTSATDLVSFTGTGNIYSTTSFYDLSVAGNTTASSNFTVNHDVSIGASAVFAGGAFTIQVGRNWTNARGAAGFTSTGTVQFITNTLTSVVQGATTFNNLTCTALGKTIQFYPGAGNQTTVSGTLTVTGAAGVANLIYLESQAAPSTWNISAAAASVSYAVISDSNAVSAITAATSKNLTPSTNSANWTFSASTLTWTGALPGSSWNAAANWNYGYVPNSTDTAVIPAGATTALDMGGLTNATIITGLQFTGGTIDASSAGTIRVNGNLQVSGSPTFSAPGNITFEMHGAAATISSSIASSIGNFDVQTAGTVSLSSTVYCRNIALTSGTLSASTRTLYCSGNITRPTSGVLTFTTGTLNMNGTGTQTLDPTSSTLVNITVSSSGSTQLQAALTTMSGNLLVTSTGSFDMYGHAFTFSGSLLQGAVVNTASGTSPAFHASSAVTLNGDTNVATFTGAGGGSIQFAAIDGLSSGNQVLTLDANSGNITLGTIGGSTPLSSLVVSSGGAVTLSNVTTAGSSGVSVSATTINLPNVAVDSSASATASISLTGAVTLSSAVAGLSTLVSGSGAAQVQVVGAIVTAPGVVNRLSISAGTNGISASSTIGTVADPLGALTLRTNGGVAIAGNIRLGAASNFVIAGASAASTIGVAGGAGTLQVTAALISKVLSAQNFVIGLSGTQTGEVNFGDNAASRFQVPLAIYANGASGVASFGTASPAQVMTNDQPITVTASTIRLENASSFSSVNATGANISFAGAVEANVAGTSLAVHAGSGTAGFNSTIGAGTNVGTTLLEADALTLGGGAGSFHSDATVTMRPGLSTSSIDVGTTSTGTLKISNAIISAFDTTNLLGFVMGHSAGTGTMTVNGASFARPLVLYADGVGGKIVVTGGTLSGTGNATLTLYGALIQLNYAGTNLATASQAISLNGPVQLGANVTVDSATSGSGADVDFYGTVDGTAPGAQSLTVYAGTTTALLSGDVTFHGHVGTGVALGNLTVRCALLTSSAGKNVAVNGASSIGLSVDDLALGGTLATGSGAVTIAGRVTNGSVSYDFNVEDGTVSSAKQLNLSAGELQNIVTTGTLTLGSTANWTGSFNLGGSGTVDLSATTYSVVFDGYATGSVGAVFNFAAAANTLTLANGKNLSFALNTGTITSTTTANADITLGASSVLYLATGQVGTSAASPWKVAISTLGASTTGALYLRNNTNTVQLVVNGAITATGNVFIATGSLGLKVNTFLVNAGSSTVTIDGGGGPVDLTSSTIRTSSAATPAVRMVNASSLALGNIDGGVGTQMPGTLAIGTSSNVGAVSQTALATLNCAYLAGSTGSTTTLGNAGNNIGTLSGWASINAAGPATFLLRTSSSLAVSANVTTSSAGALNNSDITFHAAGGFSIGASIGADTASTGILTLDNGATGAGGIAQSAGTITANGLLVTGRYNAACTLNQSNAISTLAAAFTGATGGTLGVTASGAITVGTVGASSGISFADAGHNVSITSGGTLTVNKPINAGSGFIQLNSVSDGVYAHASGAAGAVLTSTTGLLLLGSGTGADPFVADNALNSVTTLAANTSGAPVTTYNNAALSIGTVNGTAGITSSNEDLTITATGAVSQSQALSLGAGKLLVVTKNAAGANIALAAAANVAAHVQLEAQLAASAAASNGTIAYRGSGSWIIDGLLTSTSNPSAPSILIAGTGAGADSITQLAGSSIVGNRLSVTVDDVAVVLDENLNQWSSAILAPYSTSSGPFTLNSSTAYTLSGAVDGGLDAYTNGASVDLTVNAALSTSAGSISLHPTGSIVLNYAAGTVLATTGGNMTGSVVLGSPVTVSGNSRIQLVAGSTASIEFDADIADSTAGTHFLSLSAGSGSIDVQGQLGTAAMPLASVRILSATSLTNTAAASIDAQYAQLYVDASASTLVLGKDISLRRLVLYRGVFDANARVVSILRDPGDPVGYGDFVAFGAAYNPGDADIGVNALFAYPTAAAAPLPVGLVDAPLSYFPAGGTYTAASGAMSTAPSASVIGLAGASLVVQGNFYVNGMDLVAASSWSLALHRNDTVQNLLRTDIAAPISNAYYFYGTGNASVAGGAGWYATAYHMTASNSVVSNLDGGGSVRISAQSTIAVPFAQTNHAVVDGGSNSASWSFTSPRISSVETVFDNLVRVTFTENVENRSNEIQAALTSHANYSLPPAINNGTVADYFAQAFVWTDSNTDGLIQSSELQATSAYLNPLGDSSNPLYLMTRAGLRWNTDATGTSAGAAGSTDRAGTARSNVPDVSALKGMFLSAAGHNQSPHYATTHRFTATADETRPVLIAAWLGRARYAPSPAVDYDGHNLLHLRYSEPMDFSAAGGVSVADATLGADLGTLAEVRSASSFGNLGTSGATVEVAGLLTYTGTYAQGVRVTGVPALDGSPADGSAIHTLYGPLAGATENPSGAHGVTLFVGGYSFTNSGKRYWPGFLYNPAYVLDGADQGITNPADPNLDLNDVDRLAAAVVANSNIRDAAGNAIQASSVEASYTGSTVSTVTFRRNAVAAQNATTPASGGAGFSAVFDDGWDTDPPRVARSKGASNWELVKRLDLSGKVIGMEMHILDQGRFAAVSAGDPRMNSGPIADAVWNFLNKPAAPATAVRESDPSTQMNLGWEPEGFTDYTTPGASAVISGIRDSSLSFYGSGGVEKQAFAFEDRNTIGSLSPTAAYNTAIETAVQNMEFVPPPLTSLSIADDPYFAIQLSGNPWNMLTNLYMNYTDIVQNPALGGGLTDQSGNLMRSRTKIIAVERTPPTIELTISAAGGNKILVQFSKPVYGSRFGTSGREVRASDFSIGSIARTISNLSVVMRNPADPSDNVGASRVVLTLDGNLTADDLIKGRVSVAANSLVYDISQNYLQKTDFLTGQPILSSISSIAVGLAEPQVAFDDARTNTTGSLKPVTVFDGSQYLPGEGTLVIQVKNFAQSFQTLPMKLFYDANVPDRFVYTNDGLWLPEQVLGLDKIETGDSPLSPVYPNNEARSVSASSLQSGVGTFRIPGNDGELDASSVQMEFTVEVGTTPVVTLADPADLASLRPWRIGIGGVLPGRQGVTLLNNVINPSVGDRTFLQYHIAKPGLVIVTVMTLDGQIVKVMQRARQAVGDYTLQWDGRNESGEVVARGMYVIRAMAADFDEFRKVLVVKP